MKKYIIISMIALSAFTINNKGYKEGAGDFWIDIKTAAVYTTAQNTDLRLSVRPPLEFTEAKQPLETEVNVFVDPTHTFQTLVGIGGALTDAAAETFAKLPKDKKKEFIKAYYDKKEGIGYSMGRININSCDFSSDMYTYVQENDSLLKTFNLKHDEKYKIPLIKDALSTAGTELSLFVSPWSPPSWMKDNNDMLHGGKLLPKFKQSWAKYYVKFIKSYEEAGIPIWGLTVQNEPMAKQKWESCEYTAEEERDFIKNFLGPTLSKSGLRDKKLIAWDHNRDLLYQRASIILNDPAAAKYIWGIGYHWYETWTGNAMQFDNVKRVAESFPSKNLLFTEGCVERFNFDSLYSWKLGEKYGYSMINDFNAGAVGWADWNILLDEKGGPNHVGNFCFSPVIADTRDKRLHYTNSYYYIGHFSKFIRPGAKRVATSSNRDKLQATSFLNTDGKLVVVVMNATVYDIPYDLIIGNKVSKTKSLAHSISSIIAN